MNIVEKLRLMQTDHIPELGEAIAEIEHLRREAHGSMGIMRRFSRF